MTAPISQAPIITRVGFTGTRRGMTKEQQASVENFLVHARVFGTRRQFRQGCCVGADEEATQIALGLRYEIIGHPPTNREFYSEASAKLCNQLLPPKSYLSRDNDIVNLSFELLATPKESTEQQRNSGTWYTIRYARKLRRPITIILPDGSIKKEGPSQWDLAQGIKA